ncbi:MAG: M20/M25/M40 family metallo-hydrolase [Ferruginibacter sp.]
MKYKKLFTVSLLFCCFNAFAQQDSITIKRIADEVLIRSNAYDNLRFLCKKIGPRLSGSANAAKAVTETARMLREAGADTVYLQPCIVPHWVRGTKESGFVKLSDGTKRNLSLCALGNSVGTGTKGISAPVIEIKNFAELEKMAANIKGKIVFYNFPMNPTYVRTFMAYGESGAYRTRGPARAAKLGAIGVMVRSLASNINKYPHTGTTIYNDSFPKIPAVAISTEDAEWLCKQLKNNSNATASFQTNSQMLADEPSFNVIGEIRGSSVPSEIITVGGHLDSWDLAEGAEDDGTGVVQSIEIIRAFKAADIHPKRTVRAVLFMNEENGGRGSAAYLEAAKLKNENHVFALESDAGGFTPRGFGLDMNSEKATRLRSWKPLFYNYGVYDFADGGGGSDIGPLKQIGTALVGLNPDSQRYFDVHHAATDTFEAVSKRELDLGAANMAALIWLVSEYGL